LRYSFSVMLLLVSACTACTGFAVYSAETWFGMNFDYPPESDIRFCLSDPAGSTVFTMEFLQTDRMVWVSTAGMNEYGLFSSLQYQCPMVEGTSEPQEEQLYLYQLFMMALSECSSLAEVESIINSVELINLRDLTLHALIADASGNALIAEAGDDENLISMIDDNWIIMTNFKNADFTGLPPEDIVGVGDERYRRALAFIEDNYDGFGVTEAIETLQAAVNDDPVWSTKASMVFDPADRVVYIGIDGDFHRIWKLSMDDRVLQTWLGFKKNRSAQIDENGISVMELRKWE